MEEESIRSFFPMLQGEISLNVMGFVYEKTPLSRISETAAHHKLFLVLQGEGILHTDHGAFPLYRGTLFLVTPKLTYRIENVFNLQFIYISYTGSHASDLVDRVSPRSLPLVLDDFDTLIPLWEVSVSHSGTVGMDLEAKGILLYTFAQICNVCELENASRNERNYSQRMLYVRQYIDSHFTECTLTLENICSFFSYNYKYLSHEFKQSFGVSFTQYINNLRLDNARRLAELGVGSVKELALQSGYDDTLYFSKLFRQRFGVTPSAYIKEMTNDHADE